MPYVISKGTRRKICRAEMLDRWRSYSIRKRLVFQNYNRARYGEYLFHADKWLTQTSRIFIHGATT